MKGWRPYRRWILAGLAAIICGLLQVEGCYPSSLAQGDLSTTAITAAVHDWASYPAMQSVPAHYLPTAQWVGRLILPDQTAAAADPKDWVWMEIFNSPDSTLIGQRVKLQWQDSAEIQTYLDLVTRSIEFTEDTLESMALGRIHPTRLNGWAQVGPLQSLAGTRPQDDMIVALPQAAVSSDGQTVTINDIPIQVPERFYGLVKILGPDNRRPPAATCPDRPCESDYLRVQHYDLASQGFDGAIETVYIPQVPADSNGIFQSTSQGLAQSPAGEAGWYLYGAQNNEGVFVVRAIAPRRLFQLQPHTTVIDQAEALNYINFVNWRN
ncbi:MAG: CPBP family intramembrane glutamate endopeptidase, partial [Cyanobacteria bacterium P01_D01_bin.128]